MFLKEEIMTRLEWAAVMQSLIIPQELLKARGRLLEAIWLLPPDPRLRPNGERLGLLEQRFNPNHDPENGRFTSGSGGAAAFRKSAAGLKAGETVGAGTVDFSDRGAVLRQLEAAEEAFSGLEHEACLTVTNDGRMWLTNGEGAMVDAASGIEAQGGDLQGSFSYHNHPEADTWYSFSADDVAHFFEHREAFARASDQRFSYTMERTAETLDISPDDVYHKFKAVHDGEVQEMAWDDSGPPFDFERDGYHETMIRLSQQWRFSYERTERSE